MLRGVSQDLEQIVMTITLYTMETKLEVEIASIAAVELLDLPTYRHVPLASAEGLNNYIDLWAYR